MVTPVLFRPNKQAQSGMSGRVATVEKEALGADGISGVRNLELPGVENTLTATGQKQNTFALRAKL